MLPVEVPLGQSGILAPWRAFGPIPDMTARKSGARFGSGFPLAAKCSIPPAADQNAFPPDYGEEPGQQNPVMGEGGGPALGLLEAEVFRNIMREILKLVWHPFRERLERHWSSPRRSSHCRNRPRQALRRCLTRGNDSLRLAGRGASSSCTRLVSRTTTTPRPSG